MVQAGRSEPSSEQEAVHFWYSPVANWSAADIRINDSERNLALFPAHNEHRPFAATSALGDPRKYAPNAVGGRTTLHIQFHNSFITASVHLDYQLVRYFELGLRLRCRQIPEPVEGSRGARVSDSYVS